MYITSLNITWLSFIDWYSRFAFAFPFELSQQISSEKSTKKLIAVINFIKNKNYQVKKIICNNGSEFLRNFKNTCDKLHIEINYASPGDKRKVAPIEAFNKTLRSMIEKYRIGHSVTASNVYKIVKEIQNIYNNSFHNSIKNFPEKIINDNIKIDNKNKNKNNISPNLHIGDEVRIYIKDENNPFNKISPLWSKKIYTKKYKKWIL